MGAVARFAAAPDGIAYARVCERWGIDPGAALRDDVAAHSLRAHLMLALRAADEAPSTDWDAAGRSFEQAFREAGAR